MNGDSGVDSRPDDTAGTAIGSDSGKTTLDTDVSPGDTASLTTESGLLGNNDTGQPSMTDSGISAVDTQHTGRLDTTDTAFVDTDTGIIDTDTGFSDTDTGFSDTDTGHTGVRSHTGDTGSTLACLLVDTTGPSNSHGHFVTIPAADLTSTADKTYTSTGGSHDHTVTITASELATLRSACSVVLSSNDTHSHTWTLTLSSS